MTETDRVGVQTINPLVIGRTPTAVATVTPVLLCNICSDVEKVFPLLEIFFLLFLLVCHDYLFQVT